MKATTNTNKLIVLDENNGNRTILTHYFDHKLKEVVLTKNLIIVLFDPDCYFIDSQNIACVNYKGEFQWIVEKYSTPSKNDAFTGIEYESKNIFKAWTWSGNRYEINTKTEKII